MAAVAGAPSGVFTQLWAMARPWRWQIGVVAGLVVLASLIQLAPPLIVRSLVDQHLAVGRYDGLLELAVLYLAVTAGAEVVVFAYTYLAATVAQRVLNAIRVRLFGHFQQLPTAYYDQTQVGDAISRCTADVETVNTVFSSGVSSLVANLVLVVTSGVAMVLVSAPLALVSVLVLPVLIGTTRFFQIRIRAAERLNRFALGRVSAEIQESLSGIEVIRAFARETEFVQRFRALVHLNLLAVNRSNAYSAFYPPAMGTLSAAVTAILIWAGTRDALAALGISVGTLTAFIILFQRFFKPIIDVGDQWQTVQAALAGAERIFHILQMPVQAPSVVGASTVDRIQIPIDVREVDFGYLTERPVVRGVSLAIGRGQEVAVVGRTGAGKTSLLHLIAGLYAPWAGSVRIFGADPTAIDENERRRLIGVVPQSVQLFSGTVRDNVTLRDASVSNAEIASALRMVGLDALIEALADGYATQLGGLGRGQGLQLSAGQQQLLALARALVWQPGVILLDEATASVDNASDAAFRAALRTVMCEQGTAVLTIAHRLASARQADRVIVMERGRIIEQGSPQQLVAEGGRFAAMLQLESSGWDWRSASIDRDVG